MIDYVYLACCQADEEDSGCCLAVVQVNLKKLRHLSDRGLAGYPALPPLCLGEQCFLVGSRPECTAASGFRLALSQLTRTLYGWPIQVALLKTASGVTNQAVNTLCLLPLKDYVETQTFNGGSMSGYPQQFFFKCVLSSIGCFCLPKVSMCLLDDRR